MCGQLTRGFLTGLLTGLLLGGCGSGGTQVDGPAYHPPPPTDAGSLTPPDVATSAQSEAGVPTLPDGAADAGCDEDAMGTDWCIKNWPPNVGGGTIVTRQKPVDYNTCKL